MVLSRNSFICQKIPVSQSKLIELSQNQLGCILWYMYKLKSDTQKIQRVFKVAILAKASSPCSK